MASVALFAFVLFVMGGATAYMGDKLGSYIGKKRHSSFGLRPRHTAMLWTVVSGGAIAVGTLTLLFVLDSTVKTALVEGPQLVAQKALLERDNARLNRRNIAAEQQAQADVLRAAQAQAKADLAQRKLSAVSGELGLAKTTLAQSRARLSARQAALLTAQSQLASARIGLGSTHADLARAEERVRLARAGVADAQAQFRLARSQAAQAGKEVVQASRNLLALGIRQDALHNENARLIQENRLQQNLLQVSQGHPLIFRREEELGRTVVAARQTPEALRRELAVFLDQVELTARNRGAGGLDNTPAVVIPSPVEGADSGPLAREAALDALSQNIAAQSGFLPSIVVVADARYNTFRGDAVKLDLRPYANVMVFTKSTVIAGGVIDGTQPEDVVLKQLQAFLIEHVRSAALSRGIIPVHDPQSGEALVGQPIDSATWLALVKQIRQIGSNAHVTASAAEDTYSGDLLRLDLRVTSQDAPASAATAASP